ncbi:hypothetical protein [Horticoccus sp. 23ND18S-11]|uniref:hypothetical protein n=1 Tax=Horticoccus sp. 23ND18S-11 TaxID=3391832 RepID=UPI0039C8DA1C
MADPLPIRVCSKEDPWCWQSKAVRRRIRDAFDATNNVASALGVYDALCEIASDKGSETYETTHAWIQRISGVGVTTIKAHLPVFVEMGLLHISTPTLRAPSTFTLLAVSQPTANVSQPTASDSQPVASVSQRAKFEPLARSEESQKKIRRKSEQAADAAGVPLPDVLNTPAFRSAWSDYAGYRRERHLAKLVPKSETAQLSRLAEWGHDVAIQSIRETVAQQWQGLFEPKAKPGAAAVQRPAEVPRFSDSDLQHLASVHPQRFAELFSQWPTIQTQANRLNLKPV